MASHLLYAHNVLVFNRSQDLEQQWKDRVPAGPVAVSFYGRKFYDTGFGNLYASWNEYPADSDASQYSHEAPLGRSYDIRPSPLARRAKDASAVRLR